MRDVEKIWAAWRSGVYVGETKPSTRITVERGWRLQTTGGVLGTWNRGPARWFQAADQSLHVETEVPNVISCNFSRSLEGDAGTCDIVIRNAKLPIYGEPETHPGQFGTPGYYTFDHGSAQDAKARWGHMVNPWSEVLVPNALLRVYQGFGGTEKTVPQALTDENIILNGMWLIDEVVISTDGNLNIKCRDMGKLLVDQQLFPPLVPASLYPLDYHRWVYKTVEIPAEGPPVGDHCTNGSYLGSSLDDIYGQFDSHATGHPGSDAFDTSAESGPDTPGSFAHQRTYWLSEAKGAASDTVWIEFGLESGFGDINQIYYHAWKGAIEGRGVHRVMVSVFENGAWAPPQTRLGGMTPEGIPYVSTFTPGTELNFATATNLYNLPRDFRASRIRLTVTNLMLADDFAYGYADPEIHGGGYRGGARKIMACFSPNNGKTRMPNLTFTGTSIPKNADSRQGYWQARSNGQVFAFGDARVYNATGPNTTPASLVLGMAAHPDGNGYWLVDSTGRVLSYGSAGHFGDLDGTGTQDIVDIAPTPTGLGYWLLHTNGWINSFGDAASHGVSSHSATMPPGSPALARSIESHPTTPGYWVLWTDGFVTAHDLTHYGNANRTGMGTHEYVASIRRTSTGLGYWITSGTGIVQAMGDAPHKGNAALTGYEAENWVKGMCWDLIPSTVGDNGYTIQSADGNLWPRGDSKGLNYGSIGSGKSIQRSDGNYRDYCLDEESEVLTKNGWRTHGTLAQDDLVLGLDPDTDESCWQRVESIYRRDCVDREMVRMKGASFDALTTPDHRWLARFGEDEGRWRWTTSDAIRTTDAIPLSVSATGTHVPVAPTHKDHFVELVAWFWTEGWWTSHSGNFAQSEKKNPTKVQRIRSLMHGAYGEPGPLTRGPTKMGTGPLWREWTRPDGVVIFVLAKPIGVQLRAVMSQRKAVNWEFLRELTAEQLNLFIEVSVDADGSRDPDGRAKVLSQTNLSRIESFEFACILAGRPITRKKTPKHDSWSVYLHKHAYQNPIRSATVRGRMAVTRERYTGTVWCPTVEHGNFVARRHGSMYVTGNSDIIRDLVLWGGYYLCRNPQPTAARPDVYGNVENTGAWADDPLPREMFDKKPIMDAVKQLKDIVGYGAWVDSEGGFRFESLNIWGMGNYLIDGTAFNYMPEIDERVQLTSHSVTRSANQARSRLIISTADPYPAVPGQEVPKGIVSTEITPSTEPDLRGLVVPAMWINGQFLRKNEQKVMADLIDMRMWFSRRTASVACVANPLIDINDQVRVIERQSAEVYVHLVRSINVTHDLESGDFRMTLTTHWMGGTPYGQALYYLAADGLPAGGGYWQVTITGQVHASGAAELYEHHEPDSHLEWVVGFRSTPSGLGYYTLDMGGKILTYGDAVHQGELQSVAKDVIDFALTPSGDGYWVLQESGTVTAFGDAIHYGNGAITHTMPAGSPAHASSIESHPTIQGYWILYKDGQVQAFNLTHYGSAVRNETYTSHEFTACLRATPDGGGYWIPSGGSDDIQVFGNATNLGAGVGYPEAQWSQGLVWDMIVDPDGGYALQRADGNLITFEFTLQGSTNPNQVSVFWALVAPEVHKNLPDPSLAHAVTPEVMAFLAGTASPSANNAVVSNFGAPVETSAKEQE